MAITFKKKPAAPISPATDSQVEEVKAQPESAPMPSAAPLPADPPTPAPIPTPAAPSKPLGVVEGQTVTSAITEFANRGSKDKRTLMVIKSDGAVSYQVTHHDLGTGRTHMVSLEGIEIKPIITPREDELYYPMWR